MNPGRRRTLLDELSRVQEQKQRLYQRIEVLRGQQYGGGAVARPAAAAAVASVQPGAAKRPTAGPTEPDLKRQRVSNEELERAKGEFFKICGGMIKRLTGRKEAAAFIKPVDPVRDKIPDYPSIVRNPMDLGTVKQKLAQRAYPDPMSFRDDVRLIWKNCALYNQPGHVVRNWGDTMSDLFERLWEEAKLEPKWAEVLYRKNPEVGERRGSVGYMLAGVVGRQQLAHAHAHNTHMRTHACTHPDTLNVSVTACLPLLGCPAGLQAEQDEQRAAEHAEQGAAGGGAGLKQAHELCGEAQAEHAGGKAGAGRAFRPLVSGYVRVTGLLIIVIIKRHSGRNPMRSGASRGLRCKLVVRVSNLRHCVRLTAEVRANSVWRLCLLPIGLRHTRTHTGCFCGAYSPLPQVLHYRFNDYIIYI